ncbi:hypothetical protein ES332_A12G120200v1 [Gossypium tomentosum]|uniref:Subtilisin-like protease SBT1.1 n=1 Tax=Gossypium tomentosum TaxID=34277 RepID=A0A5D2MVP4_GOSTO|nr:hypothetical protein ES332_A12G120200v1 [Gossypium tomentosum]
MVAMKITDVIKIIDAAMMLLLLALMAAISTASADEQTYIVRMDKTKIPNTYSSLVSSTKPWHQAVLDSLIDVSSTEATPPELLYSYETALFGFAARLSSKQLESLKKWTGSCRRPLFLGLTGMKGEKGPWSGSNLHSDVIIGVVDSGIWPEHVSFQDHGLSPVPERWKGACENGTRFSPSNCNKKLIGARYFYGGYIAAGGKINDTEEYKSARDVSGHGTHTASTAGGDIVENANIFGLANGTATGMRYTARIAAYKVCWPGCTSVDILTAMVKAIEDVVDVLTLSLGSESEAVPYWQDYLVIASYLAFKSGIFVAFSAGNSGPDAYTVVNTAPWIMTVAASTMDRSFVAIIELGNGETFEGSSFYTGAEYCLPGSIDPKLVKGKIVICEQGIVRRTEKGEAVKSAGGAGILILSPEGEDLASEVHVLPDIFLGAIASKAVIKYWNTTKAPTASIVFKGTMYGNQAPKVAAFSSRGPNLVGPDVIKPDITAPGVDILAAWPAETSPSRLKSDKRRVLFNIISGTSMSCPHVSGIAALIKSKHKDWSPAAIKSALMTTAYTLDNKGKPIADLAFYTSAAPFAIVSMFEEGYQCTPTERRMQPGDLNYPSFAMNFKQKARNVTFTYKRTVTNVGIPKSTYKVSVEVPKGVSVIVSPKVLSFTELNEELSYEVSFTGLSRNKTVAGSSFGSLVWVSGNYRVRSPIAVSWK